MVALIFPRVVVFVVVVVASLLRKESVLGFRGVHVVRFRGVDRRHAESMLSAKKHGSSSSGSSSILAREELLTNASATIGTTNSISTISSTSANTINSNITSDTSTNSTILIDVNNQRIINSNKIKNAKLNSSNLDDFSTAFLKAGVKGGGLLAKEKLALVNDLRAVIKELSPENLMKIVTGLGYLRVSVRNTATVAVIDSLLEQFISCKEVVTDVQFSTILVGFARLGLTSVSYYRRRNAASFFSAIPRVVATMDSTSLSKTVWAMGKIGFTWDSLPKASQTAISKAIIKRAPNMSPRSVANIIHGKCILSFSTSGDDEYCHLCCKEIVRSFVDVVCWLLRSVLSTSRT